MTQWYREVAGKIQNHRGINEKFSVNCSASLLPTPPPAFINYFKSHNLLMHQYHPGDESELALSDG